MVAEAGPSTPSGFFPAPFRVSDYHRSSTPYRSSTPAAYSSPGPGYLPPRFRSSSVVSRSGEDETLRSQRFESVQRLKSTWELLAEKYGSVELEDDDEVDILSGRVVRDRGRLRSLDRREFGEISENEQEQELDTETEVSVTGDGGSKRGDLDGEDEDDQDELGEWGERSGLDVQTPAPEERPQEPRWTEEDEEDLQSFLLEEAKRRTVTPGEGFSGRRGSGEHGSEADWDSEEDQSDRDVPFVISPRRHGTRVYNELEDLFPEDEDVLEVSAEESEDELLEMNEEATRKTPAPRSPSPDSGSNSKSPSNTRLEVVIPVRHTTVLRSRPAEPRRPLSTVASASTRRPGYSSHSPPTSPTREPIPAPPPPRSLFPTPPRQLAESLFPTPPRQLAHSVISSTPSPARAPSRPSLPPSSPPRQASSPVPERPHHSPRSRPGPSRQRSTPHPRLRPSLPPSSPPPQYFDTIRDPSPSPLPDIFTSPPQTRSKGRNHAESPSTSPKSASSRSRSRRASSSSVGPPPVLRQRIRHNTPSVRALERMASEVPRDDIDLSIYHPTMHFSNTGGINRCPRCRDAGGERLERSPYCKGRHGGDRCPFEPKPPLKRRGRPPSRPPDSSESETPLYSPLATVQQNRLVTRGAAQQETKTKGQRRLTDPGPVWRQRSNNVVGSLSAPESLAQSITMVLPEPAKTRRGRLVKRRDGVENGIQSVSMTPTSAQPATEKRRRARQPRNGQPPIPSDGLSGTSAPSQTPQRRVRAPKGSSDSAQVASPATNTSGYESDDLESIADDEASPFVARMRERASSQRASSSIKWPAAAQNSRSNVQKSTSLDRPPRALSTGFLHTTASPRPAHVSTTTQSMVTATSSSSARRRPVEPPNAADREASVHITGPSPHRPIRPLPGPSHRPAPINSRIANTRTAVAVQHFTPPPSSTGHRSASISSDHIPLSIPGKSILRRPSAPSDASSSDVPRTIKRARFSLQPRSQGREYSSDPFNSSHAESGDDHDLPLFDSSPIRPFPSSSPARGYASASSSSPFSREISLRAADVGLDLGPGHTGRLPSHLVRALAPSVRSAMVPSPLARPSTLGSSITAKSPTPTRSAPTYALPTPPPSFGSTTSTTSNSTSFSSGRTASPHNAGVGAGLMLPPPVPIKRRASLPRLHTPLTPEPRVIPITILPSTAPARSRSRSVSVAPAPHKSSASKQPPLRSSTTTPRKRTRSEMDLQRLAEQIGDDAGYEWGMDEDAGEEVGRLWREGSVVRYVDG